MKEIERLIRELSLGDLVRVEWFDASIGKSLSGGLNGIDIPVVSWGIFLGILGSRNRHIILAQNCFRYADGYYDIDYTAVPLNWAVKAAAIAKEHMPSCEVKMLLNSFLTGGRRTFTHPTGQRKARR
ncbi:hypothetical protein H5T51_09545, partial [Candidatus Bathyarchaeota archaeon]|nr:hypothetical protein [Candidatus Bathyarchaeota archaeon]